MPIYKYSHYCGIKDFQQFLKVDKDSLIIKCANCGKGTLAKQVYDKSISIADKYGIKGIMRASNDSNKRN